MPAKLKYDKFYDCKLPEFCYLLGYLWADGHVGKKSMLLQIVEKDGKVVKDIIDKIDIDYSSYITKGGIDSRGTTFQTRLSFVFGIDLRDFLISLGYKEKSYVSHKKIMEFIPKENLPYWMRGYTDGDACFYYNEKYKTRQITIASTYEQDWTYLIEFLSELGIKSIAQKTLLENSKSSKLRLCGRENALHFGNFVYSGIQFGLERKYHKYLKVISKAKIGRPRSQ